MSGLGVVARSRRRFLDRHADATDWRNRFFSAGMYSLFRETRALLEAHCRGRVLDVGAGRQAWRRTIEGLADEYHSIDRAAPGGRTPTYLADAHEMSSVPASLYDTVVCTQVLEHVARPWTALAEIHRVLKPDGKLVLTVPHLSRRHELPHDYLRFTQEGVGSLLREAGFELVEMRAYGGALSFLHHQASFVLPGLAMAVPRLAELAILANAPLSWTFALIDPFLDRHRLMPLGVAAAARKTAETAAGHLVV